MYYKKNTIENKIFEKNALTKKQILINNDLYVKIVEYNKTLIIIFIIIMFIFIYKK